MQRSNRVLWLGAAAATVVVVAALLWWRYRVPSPEAATPAPPAVAQAEPAPPPAAVPVIKYPIQSEPAAAPQPLPALDQSDAQVSQALTALLGKRSVLSLLQTDGFVRRFVATIDGLPREQAASRLWPVNPTGARFLVSTRGADAVIDADNTLRYTPFVLLVENADVGQAVSLYVRLYPLFQQAYEELGYPNKYFNDRVVEVIDHLLAAPEPPGPVPVRLVEVRGPMQVTRPWVHYEFVDPELEALSTGQKLMVRVGPVNERRLKARLKAVRTALAGSDAPR